MVEIIQKEAPVLREIAKPVPLEMIGTPELNKILDDMKEALASQDDGVAIAAPQIGVSLQIFVVSRRVFMLDEEGKLIPNIPKEEAIKYKDVVYINPEIVNQSKSRRWVAEGCLSVRGLYGNTYRSEKATVRALDENGKKFVRGASGLLAQIFQHETDHLKGILFHDHAENLQEATPNEDQEEFEEFEEETKEL